MKRWHGLLAGVAVLASACDLGLNPPSFSAASLTAALSTVPVGYGDLTSSFNGPDAASASGGPMWLGGGSEARMGPADMMGGGLHDAFAGAIGFGPGGRGGPFGGGLHCAGTFASGRVSCPAETHNGLTINRSAAYFTAAGVVQQSYDSATTDKVNIQTTVAGTVTYAPSDNGHKGGGPGGEHGPHWGDGRGPGGLLLGDTAKIVSASTTVSSSSDRTVSGLATGSTKRTVNGASKGQENTTGVSSRGTFTAARTVGDTTTGLAVPVSTTGGSYPSAGSVIRVINASVQYAGQSAVTLTRREVVTYDGSATAKVVITENGVAKSCTRALPRGALACQ